MLIQALFLGAVSGGFSGSFMGFGPMSQQAGYTQSYPHCNAVSVTNDEAPLVHIRGTIKRTTSVRACIGQDDYLVVDIEDAAAKVTEVFLGPEGLLAEIGPQLKAGAPLAVTAARGNGYTTALQLETTDATVMLRDGHGKLFRQPKALAH